MSSNHDSSDQHDTRGLAPDLLALAEGSDEMIIALDASFRCTYVNPAAQFLIGPRADALGRVPWEVTPHAAEGTAFHQHCQQGKQSQSGEDGQARRIAYSL